jgi:hypothetical protein
MGHICADENKFKSFKSSQYEIDMTQKKENHDRLSSELKFPVWVPDAVQERVRSMIFGLPNQGIGRRGWRRNAISEGRVEEAAEILEEEQLLLCLSGVDDDRMREAFQLLKKSSLSDRHLSLYVDCAFVSRVNYSVLRTTIKTRHNIKQRVNTLARELAQLLREDWAAVSNIHRIDGFALRNILSRSKKTFPYKGDRWKKTTTSAFARKNQADTIRLWRNQKSQITGADLGLWFAAPSLADLLDTLATDFDPSSEIMEGLLEAAINRQENLKTEYIRGFGMLLADCNLELGGPVITDFSADVFQAIAITTNVVLNEPDIDVSLKDVKQTLKFSGITQELNTD